MANANNIAKLVYENVMNSHLYQIELVGLEMTRASGVRAIAADQAIRERGGREHFDADGLYEAVDELVGHNRLFESYNDPSNPNFEEGELELGQGCPFESLDAYLDLREVFGEEWLTLTLVEYVQRMGDEELREGGAPKLVALVSLARAEYAKARATDFECSLTSNRKRAA